MARCMIYSKGLHKCFWLNLSCWDNYILNRVPTKEVLQITPKEKWNGRKPDFSNFKIFSSECWSHIPDEKQKKLDPKSHKCIFIGYCEDSKAYRLFDTSTQCVIIRRSVQFDELSPPPWSIEPHVTLNFPSHYATSSSVTPSSPFVPIIDPSSRSF